MPPLLLATAAGLTRLEEGSAHTLVSDPVIHMDREGDTFWIITEGRLLSASTAGDLKETAPTPPGWTARCVGAQGGTVVVGTAGAHLLQLVNGSLEEMESFESAPTRDRWHTPWGGPPDVRSLAWDGTRLFVNVHVGGILAWDGASWEATIDYRADVHQVITHRNLVLAASARGLAHSSDAGTTWIYDTEGMHATYLRSVAACGDSFLVGVSTGPGGGAAAIYRGRPGEGWVRCTAGLPDWFDDNVDTHCLIGSEEWAALATGAGEVFVSDDQGASWVMAAGGLTRIRAIVWAS